MRLSDVVAQTPAQIRTARRVASFGERASQVEEVTRFILEACSVTLDGPEELDAVMEIILDLSKETQAELAAKESN